MELQNLCMGCMAETGGAVVCPQCGFAESQATTGGGLYLPPRTVLNGRYVIGRVLGQGGFGIIYLALDATLNLKVAIKEFLPRELAARGADGVSVSVYQDQARQLFAYGLEQFLAEARTLARLSEHQGIVTVRDFFTANGTGYLAMSYLDGITLKDYVARKGGRLPFLTGFRALLPVMDALREVHALGLLHRDISPDNIYLTRDNQVKLIDFGAARMALSERSKSLSVIFKPGFAPEEQYRSKGHQGPWTDVYALAGTLYYAITGHVPPESLDRLAEDTLSPPSALGVDIPPAAEVVLLKALAVRAAGRYPTVEAFQQELMRTADNRKEQEASPAPVVQTQWEQPVTPVARPVKPVVKPEKSSFEKKWMFAAGGIGVVGVLMLLLTQKPAPSPTPIAAPPPTPMPAPPPTPIPAPPRLSFEPEMVRIVGGCFQMGSPASETGREPNEKLHRVCVESFEMGKDELTVGEFKQFIMASGYKTDAEKDAGSNKGCFALTATDGKFDWRAGLNWRKPGYEQTDNYPVVCVSWNDALAYTQWLSQQTGQSYRLPTEAEWEYAARAGTTTARYWADDPDQACQYANVADQTKGPTGNSWTVKHECNDGYWYPSPVGRFQANDFRLNDMLGNVWEWTCSAYDKDYGGAEKIYTNNSTGGLLAVRGGGWYFRPAWVRSASRLMGPPDSRFDAVGFRLARYL